MAYRKSCDQCSKTFAAKRSLKLHKQTHSGGKRYNCFHCNKSFSQAGSLKTHFLIHKCNQCNFSANDASHLRRHIMKHTGEKPHKCNQCDYISIQSSVLKSHKRTHSGESLTDAQCASFLTLQLINWNSTWWGTTQGKSHSSVTSATTLAFLLVSCRVTRGPTWGRSLSNATMQQSLQGQEKSDETFQDPQLAQIWKNKTTEIWT